MVTPRVDQDDNSHPLRCLALTALVHDHKLVTMSRKVPRIPAGEFKARCLALLDEVAVTGREIIVTKRGKPVARVLPPEGAEPTSLRGSVTFHGDLVAPFHEEWAEDG